MNLQGRRRIYTSLEPTRENIPRILAEAFPIHLENAKECDWLINYTKGQQEILARTKELRVDINNKIVVNNAFAIVRTFQGYFLGEPIQFVSRKSDEAVVKEIETLNDYMHYEDKHSVDNEVYFYSSICGIAYKCTLTNKECETDDDVPFEQSYLDPRFTFEVLSTSLGNKQVLTCNYYQTTEKVLVNGRLVEKTFYNCLVYTNKYQYKYKVESNLANNVVDCEKNYYLIPFIYDDEKIYGIPHNYGTNPIVSYPANYLLMGKFELAIGIMNAINRLESNAMDDIEQVVQSILVFFGIDSNQHENLQKTRTGDVLVFSGQQGIQQDAKFLTAALDSESIVSLREALKESLKEVVGIPDRKTRGGGGGDTMGAVKLRDGWADLEVIARNDENFWRKGEKKALQVALKILHDKGLCKNLRLIDIDVKFTRNKNDDMLAKTQAGATLFKMGVPLVAISSIMGFTNDSEAFAKQWQANLDNGGNSTNDTTAEADVNTTIGSDETV